MELLIVRRTLSACHGRFRAFSQASANNNRESAGEAAIISCNRVLKDRKAIAEVHSPPQERSGSLQPAFDCLVLVAIISTTSHEY